MNKIEILRAADEVTLQTDLQAKLDNDYILIGFPQMMLDSADNEIWFCTVQVIAQ